MGDRVNQARELLASYQIAMAETAAILDSNFQIAVHTLAELKTLLVITGLGKSGLIGQKAAATFSSTGTRAVFVHPVEALHGDLGVVEKGAAMLAISKSGGNIETIEFAQQFKTVTDGVIMTLSEPNSNLEELADIPLHIPLLSEIDNWNLAPTTSTMTSMAICDVLAVCVQQQKGLTAEHFAQFHPHGTLGKQLLLHARDFMVPKAKLPMRRLTASFSEIIYEISSKGLGFLVLIDDQDDFFGVLTDGDIRRLLEREHDLRNLQALDCYRLSRRGTDLPRVTHGTTTENAKAIDCLRQMQHDKITFLVVVNKKKLTGVIRLQDLLAAGL